MNDEPSQAAIARALGLAKSRVTAMKKQGMPVHSIEAAQEWRRRHVAPIVRSTRRAAPTRVPVGYPSELAAMPGPLQPFLRLAYTPEAAVKHAAALGELAAVAIDNGTFDAIEPALRLALSAVPKSHRSMLPGLPFKVWDALCADVFAVCGVDLKDSEDTPKLLEPAEVEFMGDFWYQVAAGEIRPTVER